MPVFGDDLLPDTTGRKLGTETARYDANLRDLNVSGNITGTFTGLAIYKLATMNVPYSSTPAFDCSKSSSFTILLTGDVLGPAVINGQPGQLVLFKVTQGPAGGYAFNWPANVRGGMAIGTAPGEISTQLFFFDGTTFVAVTSGVIS